MEAFFFCPGGGDIGFSEADADDGDVKCGEFVVEVAVPATFLRSTRGVGERVEPDHRGVADEVGLSTGGPVPVRGGELGRS